MKDNDMQKTNASDDLLNAGELNAKERNSAIDCGLVQRIKDGDPAAFQELFYRWEEPLYCFLFKLLGSAPDAEDICQDTFATIWTNRASLAPDKNIKTFIYLIASQNTWKLLRKKRTQDNFLKDLTANEFYNIPTDSLLVEKEIQLLIECVVSNLPAKTREIYTLYHTENQSYGQIAQKLGINENNVRSHIHIARKKIKEILLMAILLFFT